MLSSTGTHGLRRAALRLEAGGATDIGRTRRGNEDAFAVRSEEGFFAVADGVARRPRGALASAMALALVSSSLRGDATWPTGTTPDPNGDLASFVGAVEYANGCIFREGRKDPKGQGPATTFAGLLLDGDRLCIAHVGDSRVYRLRERCLVPLTEDHCYANELIQAGMPEREAFARRDCAALTRALGAHREVEVSARLETARPGDVFLVCTDGLHNVVPAPDIAEILTEIRAVDAAVGRLIARANERGAPDNVTAVVVRWIAA